MKLKMIREDVDEKQVKEIELEEGLKIREVLENEGIPVEEVLVAVDETIVSKDTVLEGGETVRIMQVVAGG